MRLQSLSLLATRSILTITVATIICFAAVEGMHRAESKVETSSAASPVQQRAASRNTQQPVNSSIQATAEDGQTTGATKSVTQKMAAESKRKGMFLLEGVLASNDRISPIEYGILAQVEGAILLWRFDEPRAESLLANAFSTMRAALEKGPKDQGSFGENRQRRIWSSILRKVAALNPALLQRLLLQDLPAEKAREAILPEWTDEARALMSVATQQIEKDPAAAAGLAQQSMSFGYADWENFLRTLARRDQSAAERLATLLIDRLRDSSGTPILLRNLQNYVFNSDCSTGLREHFFRATAARLKRDLRPDSSRVELEDGLGIAREMARLAGSFLPNWQVEFEVIASSFAALFEARSSPLPGPTRRIVIPNAFHVDPDAQSDTRAIRDALPLVERVDDLRARDKQYQKLALKAAQSADLRLADEIILKMDDERVRQATTVDVYAPRTQRALMQDADLVEAQRLAWKIRDPLGRTIVLQRIAEEMFRSKDGKAMALELYTSGLAQLERDDPSVALVKAFLISARLLYPLSPERSLEAAKSAVSVLNRLVTRADSFEEPALASSLCIWVRLPTGNFDHNEVLDLAEVIVAAFREMARRDSDKARFVADGLTHTGLQSLAHVAISSVLLEDTIRSADSYEKPKRVTRRR